MLVDSNPRVFVGFGFAFGLLLCFFSFVECGSGEGSLVGWFGFGFGDDFSTVTDLVMADGGCLFFFVLFFLRVCVLFALTEGGLVTPLGALGGGGISKSSGSNTGGSAGRGRGERGIRMEGPSDGDLLIATGGGRKPLFFEFAGWVGSVTTFCSHIP